MRVPTQKSTTQSRCWTFTDHNVERLDIFWRSISIKHLWIGLEHGAENGTRHLQGVVVWLRPYRLSQLKKLVPGAHFEVASMVDAENYTMKEHLALERHLSDDEERVRRAERQWTSKDFRDAVLADIASGVCNRCLFKRYPGFMFDRSDRVFRWRYTTRYGSEPPWRKEFWCQNCGRDVPRDNQSAMHTFECSDCHIKVCPYKPESSLHA